MIPANRLVEIRECISSLPSGEEILELVTAYEASQRFAEGYRTAESGIISDTLDDLLNLFPEPTK